MKTLISGIFAGLLLCHSVTPAQVTDPIPVLTLGTFHFNFPNLDARQVDREDQIDVLEPGYQEEIEGIVRDLARFKPTIIVIERQPDRQAAVDSAYREYLGGNYQLTRREDEQIGFRLGKACALARLYCVDEWGAFTDRVGAIVDGKDSAGAKKFEAYYFHNPDSSKKTSFDPTFKTAGIRNELVLMNKEERLKQSLGDYLIGIFKYEGTAGDFLGADFETGRWFNRNLRIFRNIQRIPATTGDRILVIFGAGHLNLLNYLIECSPEYDLVRAGSYLE
jgi:hypothetical protein